MEEQYYGDASIAARSKREQLMKEAEEYRLHRHIAAMKKLDVGERKPIVESDRKHRILPGAKPHPAPAQ